MLSVIEPNNVALAKKTVASLLRNISDLHELVTGDIRHLHDEDGYEEAARDYALAANKLEKDFSKEIRRAARTITAISRKGWEKDKTILCLWHKVALAVTKFSEHADKPVAALLISERGALLAFSANRMLNGVPKKPAHYVRGKRRHRIACAEKLAIAQKLKIGAKHREIPGLSDTDSRAHIKNEIQHLSDDILSAAQKGARLEKCFILTTVPSCMSCAEAIAALKIKGIITNNGAGDHFECKDEMVSAEIFLERQGIRSFPLPQKALAR